MKEGSKAPRVSRRGFLTASAGLGAIGLAPRIAAATSPSSHTGTHADSNLTEAVLEAFSTYRLVGLGEAHDLQEHHDVLQTLLADPRLPDVIDDIVVEFGNGSYQGMIDSFVLDGQPVADKDLRPVWRDTTQSPLETYDEPVYEQFFRRVRAVNWALPPSKRIRVLLGDPSMDWSQIQTLKQKLYYVANREQNAANVVEQQVLAKGRRALLNFGIDHLLHDNAVQGSGGGGGNLVSLIEEQTGVRTYVISDLLPLAGDPGSLAVKLAPYRRGTIIPTAGTWLGTFNASDIVPTATMASGNSGPSPFCGVPYGKLIDAGLYLGQPADLTTSWPNPAIYLDTTYWDELQRRNTPPLGNGAVDLDNYRLEHPPAFQLYQGSPC